VRFNAAAKENGGISIDYPHYTSTVFQVIYAVTPVRLISVDGSRLHRKDGSRWDGILWEGWLELAEAPRKFKLGDAVKWRATEEEHGAPNSFAYCLPQGPLTVTATRTLMDDKSPIHQVTLKSNGEDVTGGGVVWYGECWLDAAPAVPAVTIDQKKSYQTRDGREVRIYAVNGDGNKAIHGAIKRKDGTGYTLSKWSADGKHGAFGQESPCDLVEPKKEISGWMNVYDKVPPDRPFRYAPKGGLSAFPGEGIFNDKNDADNCADYWAKRDYKRIACVPVTFKVGAGL
jgi:hypothetical protein